MVAVFYFLGTLGIIFGFGWSVLAAIQPAAAGEHDPWMILHWLMAIAPGLGLTAGGLVFLALAGVLSRLDQIVENTGR